MERAEWDSRYQATELIWTASPNRFVVEELTGLRPGRALDLGAGEGRNAVWLAERGWRVTAVDFSAVGLAKARRLAESRGVSVNWVEADLRGYAPEPGAYDLVLVAYLHLLPVERSEVLRRATQALAPAGTLLVVGHDLANLTEGVGGPQDPNVLYTPESVAADLDGLDIRRAARVGRPVDTEARPRQAIDTLVRAVRA
ncbi:MAG: methyltransferase domain-containing protein [Streptosporangiales bacterium]|nr:methyltransferase domain-containing protein [Streptosporangiales bacterium]